MTHQEERQGGKEGEREYACIDTWHQRSIRSYSINTRVWPEVYLHVCFAEGCPNKLKLTFPQNKQDFQHFSNGKTRGSGGSLGAWECQGILNTDWLQEESVCLRNESLPIGGLEQESHPTVGDELVSRACPEPVETARSAPYTGRSGLEWRKETWRSHQKT